MKTRFKKVLGVTALIWMASSAHAEDSSRVEFKLERTDHGIELQLGKQDYHLSLDQLKNLVTVDPKELSREAANRVRLIVWIQEGFALDGKPATWEEIENRIFRFTPDLNEVREQAITIAFNSKKLKILQEIRECADNPQTQAIALVHEAMLERSASEQLRKIQEATQIAPQSEVIRDLTENYSLTMAEKFVSHYYDLLLKSGPYLKMGLGNSEEMAGGTSFWTSFMTAGFNTVNALTLLATNYDENLLQIWEAQTAEVFDLLAGIKLIRQQQAKGYSLSEIIQGKKDFFHSNRYPRQVIQVLKTPFIQDVLTFGIFQDKKMILESLGFDPKEFDLIHTTWGEFFLEQVNIANIWMLWRGPVAVEAFGASAAGQWTVKTFRLQGIVNAATKLPRFWQRTALWLIFETADGCLIRYAYVGYLGWKKWQFDQTDLGEDEAF